MSEETPQSRGPLPPAILLAAIALMFALHFFLPIASFLPAPLRMLGGALIVIGAVLNVWADRLFSKADTAVKPFEPSTSLVLQGPFALTRNPMYLGMLLILVGIAVAFGSVTPWLVVPFFAWHIRQRFIVPEEHKLEAIFGARYIEYKGKVRRWL